MEINGQTYQNVTRADNTFDVDGMSITLKGTFENASTDDAVSFTTTSDADKIVDIIYRQASDGDIILLHDRYQNTVDAVLRAVPHLQEQGYVFVTVSELLARKGVTPEPGVTYRRAS